MGNEKYENEKIGMEAAGGASPAKEEDAPGEQPDFRVVQPEVNIDGTTRFKSVGGLWHNISKNGKEFYTLKIGKLKLLVFANDRDKFAAKGAQG